MRLTVVSHACVTPINQSFYADVQTATGWEVDLVIPAIWATEYKAAVRVERWPAFTGGLHAVPVWKPGNIPLHVYKNPIVGLLKRTRPDAIYVHHEPYGLATFQVYMANHLAGPSPIGFYAAQNILKRYPPPFRWFEKYVMARSDFALPVAQGSLDVLRAKGYTGPAEVLPLPIDIAVYRRRAEWAEAKRIELGLVNGEFVIGYLGRLVEEKGLHTLLKACARLRGRWSCVLVGSGPFEASLRTLAAGLGVADRIVFAGFVPHEESPGWFSLFDVFALPSETRPHWKEQFGRVIVEANACETAVVGSDSGEIGSVLRSTGGGVLVPEGNPEEFAEAIQRLMDEPERRLALARSGSEAARTQYEQRQLARRFAAVVQRAVDDAAARGKR